MSEAALCDCHCGGDQVSYVPQFCTAPIGGVWRYGRYPDGSTYNWGPCPMDIGGDVDFRGVTAPNELIVMACNDAGDVWRSTNRGDNWASENLSSDPLNGMHSFGRYAIVVGDGGFIATSDDCGATWTTRTSGTAGDLKAARWVNHGVVYVCGGGGLILKSINSGVTWSALTTGVGDDLNAIDFDPYHPNVVCAVGDNGSAILTTDRGATWTALTGASDDGTAVICRAADDIEWFAIDGGSPIHSKIWAWDGSTVTQTGSSSAAILAATRGDAPLRMSRESRYAIADTPTPITSIIAGGRWQTPGNPDRTLDLGYNEIASGSAGVDLTLREASRFLRSICAPNVGVMFAAGDFRVANPYDGMSHRNADGSLAYASPGALPNSPYTYGVGTGTPPALGSITVNSVGSGGFDGACLELDIEWSQSSATRPLWLYFELSGGAVETIATPTDWLSPVEAYCGTVFESTWRIVSRTAPASATIGVGMAGVAHSSGGTFTAGGVTVTFPDTHYGSFGAGGDYTNDGIWRYHSSNATGGITYADDNGQSIGNPGGLLQPYFWAIPGDFSAGFAIGLIGSEDGDYHAVIRLDNICLAWRKYVYGATYP